MTQANGRADTSGAEENKPQPPRFLLISRMLWIVAALVSALRTIWQLADREALIDVLHKAQPDLPQDQIDAAANSGILFALLLQALILLVVVRLTNRLLQGRNWVRVVLSIYGPACTPAASQLPPWSAWRERTPCCWRPPRWCCCSTPR